jgi:hypothetical protein
VCPEIQGLEMKIPYADVVPLASGAAGRDDGFDDAYAKFFNTSDYGFVPYYDYADDGYGFDSTAFPTFTAFPGFSFPPGPSLPAASSFPAFPTFPAPLAADGADGTAGTAATDTVKASKALPQRPVASRIPVPPRQQHGRRRLPVEIHLGDAVDASATPTRSVSATISVSSTARPKYVAGTRGCASDK